MCREYGFDQAMKRQMYIFAEFCFNEGKSAITNIKPTKKA